MAKRDPTYSEIKEITADLKRCAKIRNVKEKQDNKAAMDILHETRTELDEVVRAVATYYKSNYISQREKLLAHVAAVDAENKRMVEQLVLYKQQSETQREYALKYGRESAEWKRRFVELVEQQQAVAAERPEGGFGTEDAPEGYFCD
tara:strand:- start:482 stop:922 length:441 start_codon:yes stop_codon:yes gene_type:complete